jgi:hypothetical protein
MNEAFSSRFDQPCSLLIAKYVGKIVNRQKIACQTLVHLTWSQSYDHELQRQRCKKFTTPRVA